MNKSVKIVQYLFAIALIGFGSLHLITGDFVSGRAIPLPHTNSLYIYWAYVTGVLFIITGLAILIGRQIKLLLIADGIVVFAWAFLRSFAALINHHPIYDGLLTNTGKGLALTGSLMIVASSMLVRHVKDTNRFWTYDYLDNKLTKIGLYFIGIFLIICGIQHFIFTVFCASLVPAWIPGHMFWTYFAGVALISGGIGIMLKPTRPLAAALSGIMILLWTVMLHIERVAASNFHDYNEITSFFETIAFGSALLVLPCQVYKWKPFYKSKSSVQIV
jgi:uncharacterized membrane protein